MSHDVKEIVKRRKMSMYSTMTKAARIDALKNMTYPEINAKLKNVENWINELKNYLKNKKTDFLKLDNVFLKKDDIDCLDEANSFFLKKFNNDIEWFKSNRPNASNNKKNSL